MRDLSLHLLDLTMNSIRAHASNIEIQLIEKMEINQLILIIKDNGCGMNEEMVKEVQNPFFTTRTTREVGLGLSLLSAMTERCEGQLVIKSSIGKGTEVMASLTLNHIDCPPFGDVHNTLISLIYLEPTLEFKYIHQNDCQEYCFDTAEVKAVLGDIPINHPSIMEWIQMELSEGDFSFNSY